MRRFAVLIAILGVAFPSWAQADPFERLARGLEHYDADVQQAQHTESETTPAASAPQQETVPTPVPEPSEGIHPQEPMWDEPFMDYGAGSCDSCDSCGTCGGCGCGGRFWGRAEYLVWWVRGASTPPLVTTSPDGTPVGSAGVLPNATILYGNERINTNARSGGRFTLGYFCDPCQELGIEDTFFLLGNGDDSFFATSSGSPILARPFFNTETDAQDALLLAYPQIVVGSINVTSNRTVTSNELNLRRALVIDCCRRVDILAGYRYFHLGEGLGIRTNTTSIDGQTVPVGTTFLTQDIFGTANNFNAGQLGVNMQFFRGCWTLDVLCKLALGGVSQRVDINGSTTVTVPDEEPVTNEGGVLALDSNIGKYRQTRFGIMPEIGVNLRYQWSPLWTFSLGYTFIGLTNVVRPGDQIDLQLDPAQFPPGVPGTFPQFAFHDSDVWVQGLNFGIECDF
jgi:hypothetical protein